MNLTRPRAVAQICLTEAWGGMEMSCVEYARLFAERGYTSYGICLAGSRVEKHFHLPEENILPLKSSAYFAPRQSYALRRFIVEHKIEVVFCHLLKDLWMLYPATLGLDVRLFGFAHMFLRDISKKDLLHGLIYGRLERLFALSDIQRHHLLECLPVTPERTLVLPNGVDLERFGPHRRSDDLRRAEFAADANDLVVGVIGRLDPQKGQLEFIEAVARVAEKFTTARFVLIGQTNADGADYLEILRARVGARGLSERVVFAGHRPDVAAHMASLDIFVLPSYEEAFGKVTIEAMASGPAIIGTRSGSTPEILADGRCGRLVTPRDVGDLAEALSELLASKERRRALSRAAFERVREQFSLTHVMDRLQGEVERVV